jgi:multimeric flavodoxin WrbA
MQPLYRKLESADIVIVGSPVFFGSISAQLKMMIDRTQCLWARKYILGHVRPGPKRKGIFLCTAGRDDKRRSATPKR